ncbi:AAA family ATPase [bacterium]|nr:AAA family ATPase [bacterium]
MFKNRNVSSRIRHLTGLLPSLVITRARQVGKTPLLKRMFPNYSYVSLDSIPDTELADNSPDLFFEKYPPPVLIDEVQYAPSIFRHLKVRIDKKRELKGQYILTGSQKFVLMKGVSES